MSRSPARPEEAEQYCPGLMIRQCRHPTFEEYDITTSGSIHNLACIPRVNTSGLQTHLHQEATHYSPQKNPQITMPDRSNARVSDTQRTLLVSPVPAPGFEEGRDASLYYPPSGEANASLQYTPDDALSQAERQSEGEENLESTGSDGDEDCNGGERTKVERLAEKRKMKRFRSVSAISLAHTHQTSYQATLQLAGTASQDITHHSFRRQDLGKMVTLGKVLWAYSPITACIY